MNGHDSATRRVIAIDGPAASGKSSTAAAVAERLGFVHLNSGLLYRAYTWQTLREAWVETGDDYADLVAGVDIGFRPGGDGYELVVDGVAPGTELRGRDVAARVSTVASVGAVRAAVLQTLHQAAGAMDLVCDGRDIGTTVFPSANLKIFLVADAAERARRRLLELGDVPDDRRLAEETDRLLRRDEADATRELSPLRKAVDALEIDTTTMSLDEVVGRIVDLATRAGIERRETR